MNNSLYKIVFFLALVIFIAGCATSMKIQTAPSGADVKVYANTGLKGKVKSDTIFKIQNQTDFFNDAKVTKVLLEVSKDGYQVKPVVRSIEKGVVNELDIIKLKPLSTYISIETNPPGASINFYENMANASNDIHNHDQLPFLREEYTKLPSNIITFQGYDYSKTNPVTDRTATSPWSVQLTEESAERYFKKIRCIKIEKEGYIPLLQEINIRPGESNVFAYNLNEMSTTLKVISEPPGVEVVDLNESTGFGYLGKTPFVKNFTYRDCNERREYFWRDRKIVLTLEGTLKNYENEYRKYEIPFGEEMTVKFHMKPRSTQITFQTDPEGAHVYVYREKERDVWSDESKSIQTLNLKHEKHLGTTPFTYFMDPSDPLEHGDVLIFRKPGFKDNHDRFKTGISSYHIVLEPKGDISHDVKVN